MFDALSDKFQSIFRTLRGYGKLSEANITDALTEVRRTLLEADVNARVADNFLASVRDRALGQEVLQSVTPGQQIIKIIHDELAALMGGQNQALDLSASPSFVMLVGLHGTGKTTTAAKLAKMLALSPPKGLPKRRPLLVACDPRRPAAIDQLETLGRQIGQPVFSLRGEVSVLKICEQAREHAQTQNRDVLIFDTAGRLQIDEPLIRELAEMKRFLDPHEILLVADAATGQQAVSIAEHFDRALGLTGIILTKLDGDARGGAALSMRAVTGKPIKFAGIGEKLEEFEPFHPDRLASRILGMGDVVSLVEKAQETFDTEQTEKLEEKLRKQELTLEDFLEQLQQIKKMGSIQDLVAMIPGASQLKNTQIDNRQLSRSEAIVRSMTLAERRRPEILNASRRARIARGSGSTVAEVNTLLQNFAMMKQMMKQAKKGGKGLAFPPNLPRGGLSRGPKKLRFR